MNKAAYINSHNITGITLDTALQEEIGATSNFSVPSLRCAGCIAKLEKGLICIQGIESARVNFTSKRVSIKHAPHMQMPQLVDAFQSLGFDAHPIGDQNSANQHEQDSKMLLRAVAVSGFAMMNIMLLSVSIWSGANGVMRDMFHWLSALIALPTVAYAGQPFFKSAWRALKHFSTNMDVPIAIGITITTALSLYETATSGPHAYFDGVVMLLFFLLTGRYLDAMMRDRARDGVTALLKNIGSGATIMDSSGHNIWVSSKALEPDMVMRVAAGERLAADGIIIKGATQIDKSLLTGESKAMPAGVDSRVYAGTLNLGAPIDVRIVDVGDNMIIADIARLMDEAAQSKSYYVRIADRAARYYAPAVHTLALGAFIGWMLAGAGWHSSLLISVAVLIITCPCALGLAVPAAQIVTAGSLMRAGVLIKDGSAMERLAEIDMALFDKTGTLTTGKPQLINSGDIKPNDKMMILALAQASHHPLSKAIVETLQAENISPHIIEHLSEKSGVGITAQTIINGQITSITLGRAANDMDDNDTINDDMLRCYFQCGGKNIPLYFDDALRPDVAETITQLEKMGVPCSIISGDRAAAVDSIAKLLGMRAISDMHPQDKFDMLQQYHAKGRKVLMVGDGLNDGPALAAGHASMAPASASDASKNAADLVWMSHSIAPIAKALKAARRSQNIVRQNFALAIGYNIIAVPLALMGLVTPLIAALAMSGSSLIVVANALRLRGAAQ